MTEKKYTPHVHAEVIKAWADGKPIEFLYNGLWKTYCPEDGNPGPAWYPEYRYRVKPEEVVDYTIVFRNGAAGCTYYLNMDEVKRYYVNFLDNSQGFCKRTTIDGKVVALEFIPR